MPAGRCLERADSPEEDDCVFEVNTIELNSVGSFRHSVKKQIMFDPSPLTFFIIPFPP